jgi:hypothetical protein
MPLRVLVFANAIQAEEQAGEAISLAPDALSWK